MKIGEIITGDIVDSAKERRGVLRI